jgi:hypothetical protein
MKWTTLNYSARMERLATRVLQHPHLGDNRRIKCAAVTAMRASRPPSDWPKQRSRILRVMWLTTDHINRRRKYSAWKKAVNENPF